MKDSLQQITPRDYLNQKGIEYRESNGELIIKCIFNGCDEDSRGNEAHLYMSAGTGQYHCKKCDASGGIYTFAEHLGDELKEEKVEIVINKPKEEKDNKAPNFDPQIAEECHKRLPNRIRKYLNERGITDSLINQYKLGYGQFYKRGWITIPIKNKEGKYAFLKLRQDPVDKDNTKKYMFYPTGSNSTLFGRDVLEDNNDYIVICEGELDKLILEKHSICAVTSTAGANTFKKDWVKEFEGLKKIYICYDNDDEGKKGTEKVIEMLSEKLEDVEIYNIKLPEKLGDKADITDLDKLHKYKPEVCFADKLFDWAEKVISPCGVAVNARTQTPHREILLKNELKIADVLEKTRKIGCVHDYLVEIAIAVYISVVTTEGNPIWIMVVGNPSSNKTALVNLLKHAPLSYRLDTMTTNPFSSGQKKKDKPQDLLPLLDGKCFVVKDYTTIFGRNEETVRQLLTDLVSIYDGEYSKHSPNRGTIKYESMFSHIGCITPMALNKRQRYMNMVGARFLQVRVPPLTEEQREKCLGIAWTYDKAKEKEAAVYASSFAEQLVEKVKNSEEPAINSEIAEKINKLAIFMARARGVVITKNVTFVGEDDKKHSYNEPDDVQIEEPFRALHQIKKLAVSLAHVRGRKEVTIDDIKDLRTIALSSMPVRRAELIEVFNERSMLTAKDAAELMGKNYRTAKRCLDELCFLEVFDSIKEDNDKARTYFPREEFKEIISDELTTN